MLLGGLATAGSNSGSNYRCTRDRASNCLGGARAHHGSPTRGAFELDSSGSSRERPSGGQYFCESLAVWPWGRSRAVSPSLSRGFSAVRGGRGRCRVLPVTYGALRNRCPGCGGADPSFAPTGPDSQSMWSPSTGPFCGGDDSSHEATGLGAADSGLFWQRMPNSW